MEAQSSEQRDNRVGEDLHRIRTIKECIESARGPCSLEYIYSNTGYDLTDPALARIYNYFIDSSKEDSVKGIILEYDEVNRTFEYKKKTAYKTEEEFLKHLEEKEEYRTEGIPAEHVIDILCTEDIVTDARKKKKIVCLQDEETKKITRIFYFKEGEDCEVYQRNKEIGSVLDTIMNDMKDKNIEQELEKMGLFVFKNPEEPKDRTPSKPKRGRRAGTTIKSMSK